ncbi:MAG: hypothetical protein NT045_04940 [Candidatus Aureabacteria bacterium]|nr:hypothetical protein [Candidatus Auribacterota bacterium]
MRRVIAVSMVFGIICAALLAGGCRKRYIPRVTEEVIDPGVPISQDTVVE